jgi:2-polyprenyl-3-methyl-5-hydroxy-6-metoxy-1,4-benzoquinol methylase
MPKKNANAATGCERPAGLLAGGTDVDLGAGFGLHSIPLAERGFAATAIDRYK